VFDRVTACVDGSRVGVDVLRQASAMARIFGVPLVIVHVLESSTPEHTPQDPLDWHVQRQAAEAYLDQLVSGVRGSGNVPVARELLHGRAAEQICRRSTATTANLTVLGRYGEHGPSTWRLSGTARKILEAVPGSVLLVPDAHEVADVAAEYRRVMVPLDGSSLAERAVTVAARVAGAHETELLLVHVVPQAGVVRIGPPGEHDSELERRVTERNEEVARTYLDRIRARLRADGIAARVLVLRPGDARTRLVDLVAEEAIDLVVCSAHGHSRPPSTSCGSVAEHLLTHVSVPMLVLRQSQRQPDPDSSPGSDTRRPVQAA
jgi:nucleotide-binding universal stress UspA family protein